MKLVDTSAWIEFLRDRESEVADRVEELVAAGEAGWCELIAVELWNGARGEKEKRALEELEEAVVSYPLDAMAWATAKDLARKCRQSGVTAPTVDVVVAGCAFRHGLEIEHRDAHFEEMKRVWTGQ